MSLSLADARFLIDRALGLIRRGVVSLHTRGWQASWQRMRMQFRRAASMQRVRLYAPEPAPFAPFSVPYADAPRVSIVIPVYGQFAHTLACLRALAGHPPQASIEILVVDDGSSDATTTALPQVDGLRYHRRASNGGFIAACNDGAALARGVRGPRGRARVQWLRGRCQRGAGSWPRSRTPGFRPPWPPNLLPSRLLKPPSR